MLNKTIIILFVIALTLSNFDAFAQKTTIWLVRHAEKLTTDPADKNPELSAMGLKRATDLSKALQKQKISTIYTTNYKRTIATALPLATVFQLTPVIYDANDLHTIAIKALQDNKSKTALIVGHSNTLIPIIKALDCPVPFEELSDDDYDMLFKVTVDEQGNRKLTISNYGEAHHAGFTAKKKTMGTSMMSN
jgi:2,3-bisphosphoglycerate-dependent phosphoglycerate mutase